MSGHSNGAPSNTRNRPKTRNGGKFSPNSLRKSLCGTPGRWRTKEGNPRLRDRILAAKVENMPKTTSNALSEGLRANSRNHYEETNYEAMGSRRVQIWWTS